MLATDLAALYRRDLRRLVQQIEAFPDTASLWRTLPGISNAAGTLALHLEGNLREYVGRQLGAHPYTRDRPLEFSARDVSKEEIVSRLVAVAQDVPNIIGNLSETAIRALYPEPFYGAAISTRQFLIHLNGHLNYHLGQIDYLRRAVTGQGAIALAGL